MADPTTIAAVNQCPHITALDATNCPNISLELVTDYYLNRTKLRSVVLSSTEVLNSYSLSSLNSILVTLRRQCSKIENFNANAD